MSVNFYIESRLNRKGEAAVRVSASIAGVRVTTSAGCTVVPSKWSLLHQQMKVSCLQSDPQAIVVNSRLLSIRDALMKLEGIAMLSGEPMTKDRILDAINGAVGRKKRGAKATKASVREALELFFGWGAESKAWSVATLRLYENMERVLLEWKKVPKFEDFSKSGLEDFVTHLRTKRRMRDSTVLKQLTRLKTFLTWCAERKLIEDMSFKHFKVKTRRDPSEREVVYLEWDELMRLYHIEIPASGTAVKVHDAQGKEYAVVIEDAEGLVKTRDVFCFCAFTSLRYSDAQNLKWRNVTRDATGPLIDIAAVKTGAHLRINLNNYAQELIERYRDRDFGGYVLPRITNQRMNVYLKVLGQLCELNSVVCKTYYRGSQRVDDTRYKYQFLGTHTARRTFICNAIQLAIPSEVIMKWTGHSDYAAMKPYIDVADKGKAAQMEKFNEKMI